MGLFAAWLYDDRGWQEVDPSADVDFRGPALRIYVHDSDYAKVQYAPAGPGSGTAFLNGSEAFDLGSGLSADDPQQEAQGLATWWATKHGQGDTAAKAEEVRPLLFDEKARGALEDVDPEDLSDADVFAEMKAQRLVEVLDLPPFELPG